MFMDARIVVPSFLNVKKTQDVFVEFCRLKWSVRPRARASGPHQGQFQHSVGQHGDTSRWRGGGTLAPYPHDKFPLILLYRIRQISCSVSNCYILLYGPAVGTKEVGRGVASPLALRRSTQLLAVFITVANVTRCREVDRAAAAIIRVDNIILAWLMRCC